MATPKKIKEQPVVETLELVMAEPEVLDSRLSFRLLKLPDGGGYEVRVMPQNHLIFFDHAEQPARITFENLFR